MSNVQGNPTITQYVVDKMHLGALNVVSEKIERFVVYVRVSTQRQGASGLGIDAQMEAVSNFFSGRTHEVLHTFTEIESGKRSDRPELLKALDLCRKRKATLVIAKLDRLGRNVAFISSLMESNVEFICVDNPHANRLMLHMLAAFAEFERELISKRTKAALQAAKARGVKLGLNGRRLAEQHKAEARLRDQQHYPIISQLMHELRSYRAVAIRMNDMSISTPSGGRWYASSIRNVCLRAL